MTISSNCMIFMDINVKEVREKKKNDWMAERM